MPIFPVGDDKRPAVKHWQKVTLHASRIYAQRFPNAETFGFCPGRVGITVLDIDSADQAFADDLFARYGQPQVLIRTASGKLHGYYKHNGEGRIIKPEGLPYDVLGDGFAIAPYSVTQRGIYEFERGDLESLNDLTPMQAGPAVAPVAPANENAQRLRDGDGRNKSLFQYLGPQARSCDDREQLLDVARHHAKEAFHDAMPDAEIVRTVDSVWRLQVEGRNRIGLKTGEQQLMISGDVIARLTQNHGLKAAGFYVWARSRFQGLDTFTLPNGLSKTDGIKDISKRDVPACRKALVDEGLIILERRNSHVHGPDLFRWPA
ncbi:bifunctional DNA primase/polymerase [Brevundimonas sp. P7753]|uniref:bifunctional DNA primase/polymerase n=1 Tax=Brevundimonas sp. P7753 TaxID=2726982 RepID=UPI00351B3DB3